MSEENLYKDTVADGIILCKSCSMPMTKAQDFGVEMNGSANRTYCCHCIACITTRRCVSDIKRMPLMETKNSSNLLPISETLLIPLVARATETARGNPIWCKKFGYPDYYLKDYWGERSHHMVWRIEVKQSIGLFKLI